MFRSLMMKQSKIQGRVVGKSAGQINIFIASESLSEFASTWVCWSQTGFHLHIRKFILELGCFVSHLGHIAKFRTRQYWRCNHNFLAGTVLSMCGVRQCNDQAVILGFFRHTHEELCVTKTSIRIVFN